MTEGGTVLPGSQAVFSHMCQYFSSNQISSFLCDLLCMYKALYYITTWTYRIVSHFHNTGKSVEAGGIARTERLRRHHI